MLDFLRYKNLPDIDSVEASFYHAEMIKKKGYLRKIYRDVYQFFKKESENIPPGKKVELGSGGGFIKEVMPEVITTDIKKLPFVDMIISAEDLPFSDESLSCVFMFDVFHHIPDVEKFLEEVCRVLVKNGKLILVEPANTKWSRFIYKNFHHEPFNPNAKLWQLLPGRPMSMANGALPWIVFIRDRHIFEKKYPSLNIDKISFCYPFRYLISGGLSFKQLLPDFTYNIIKFKEDVILLPFMKFIGMFMKIVIIKR